MRQSILELNRRLCDNGEDSYSEAKAARAGWSPTPQNGSGRLLNGQILHQELATFTCNEQLEEHREIG